MKLRDHQFVDRHRSSNLKKEKKSIKPDRAFEKLIISWSAIVEIKSLCLAPYNDIFLSPDNTTTNVKWLS